MTLAYPIPDAALDDRLGFIGTSGSGDPIEIDVERLVGSHACIVANSGGGKSGLIRRMLEVTHGRIQHIVLDVEDEFYTLREHFDYVIAGGDGGDAPATVEAAPGLALAALEHGFSLIVQLNDLGPEDAPRFVGRFLESLISSPRRLWRPLLVVLDEAQRFAPQEGATEATHGVRALTAQGRKRGFTAILASQRIAKIDADVRGDVNNWMLGRVGQSLDRRTMADALGFSPSSTEARGLQGLPDRTFWGFGPALSREPILFRVADVETTPVRPGQAKVPTPPPPEALRAILAGLAKAEPSPTTSGLPPVISPTWPDQREEVERLEGERDDLRDRVNKLATEREHFKAGFEDNRRRIELALKALGIVRLADLDDEEWANGLRSAKPAQQAVPLALRPAVPPRHVRQSSGGGDLTAAAQKMVDTLARFYPRALPIEHITKIAVVSMKSSQWPANKRSFEGSPLVEPFGGQWRISGEGVAELNLTPAPNSPGDLLRFWTASFTPSTASMLRAIVGAGGNTLSRDEICVLARVSPTSSGVGVGLKELRDHDLIVPDGNGYYASAVLLP